MNDWKELLRCLLLTTLPFILMFAIDKSIKRDKAIIITDEKAKEVMELLCNLKSTTTVGDGRQSNRWC